MIHCDTLEEREALKKLVWACYEVLAADKMRLRSKVKELQKALDDLAEVKL